MKIVWTEHAIDRVTEIAEYIALDNPITAEKWVNKLFDEADKINNFIKRFRKVKESSNPNHKEIIFGNYRIIFKITPKTYYILTVRSFKQILPESDLQNKL